MKLLEAYVHELGLIRSSGAGVPETSYYGPLAEMLNALGKTLSPRVRCIMTLSNQGAGLPDGGLFTPGQFKRGEGDPLAGQIPARGVIEVKPAAGDAWVTADGSQVSRYWEKYRQVLVTNYRDFVFLGQDVEGRPVKRELLADLIPRSFPGVKTSRDDVVVDIDREMLVRRMEQYFDPGISHEEMRRIAPGAMASTASFDAEAVRDRLRKRGFLPEKVVRYCYRPFDLRWLYWEPEAGLLDRCRPEYFPHVFEGNVWLVAQQKPRREWSGPQVIRNLGCIDLMDRSASCLPLRLRPAEHGASLFDEGGGHDLPAGEVRVRFNVSEIAARYLARMGVAADTASLFYHALAVLHSPAYCRENAGALRQDWPRVPLPDTAGHLLASADLGRCMADLLDPERPVPGVTVGTIRPELRLVARAHRIGGGSLDPSAGDLELTAGWGYAGQGGVTMPGQGHVGERAYAPEELAALQDAVGALDLSPEQALALLGESTLDVYLNQVACWRNVPVGVWEYTIGGYQVVKKWLSYRERKLLGRPLSKEEVREVTGMVRRIAAILLLQPQLDANYQRAKDACYPWEPRS